MDSNIPLGAVDRPCADLLSFVFEGISSGDDTKPVYIDAEDPSRCLSKIETKILVRQVIGGWKAAGLVSGNPVLIVLANNVLYPALYFSIIGAGGVYLGANPTSQVFELNHIIQLSRPKFIITSQDILPNILEASECISLPTESVFVLNPKTFPLSAPCTDSEAETEGVKNPSAGKQVGQHTDFTWLAGHPESDWIRIHDEPTARSTPAAMFSTSGTSGLPKIAISSHFALITQHLSMETVPSYDVSRLISLPLFHVFAALFAHVFPIRLGQPLYILPRFHLEQYVNTVKQFKITDSVMAPPIVHALNRSQLHLPDLLNSIRWIGVGGAPIAAEHMQKFRTMLHTSATLSQVWGMTEIGVAMLVRHPEQDCDGSIGRPLPGYETKLIDSFGNTVTADHEPGELHIRYDGMMTGYMHQPPRERGDWYATGDIMARVEGKYYVVGRSKELIKVNGWQVAPAELEAVLLSHPCISDAGVIGVLQDDGSTEVPRAYVVRNPDSEGRCSTLSAKEIYDFARSKLASYKSLNGGIFFVDWIPRTASGKIQRFKLAQMDQYRHSVTELLMLNTGKDSERKREKINNLKARAEERRTGTRRSSRIASTQTSVSENPDDSGPRGVAQVTGPRRRSRTSLVDKMKALEATRILVNPASIVT